MSFECENPSAIVQPPETLRVSLMCVGTVGFSGAAASEMEGLENSSRENRHCFERYCIVRCCAALRDPRGKLVIIRRLAREAEREGVSLNQWIVTQLAS